MTFNWIAINSDGNSARSPAVKFRCRCSSKREEYHHRATAHSQAACSHEHGLTRCVCVCARAPACVGWTPTKILTAQLEPIHGGKSLAISAEVYTRHLEWLEQLNWHCDGLFVWLEWGEKGSMQNFATNYCKTSNLMPIRRWTNNKILGKYVARITNEWNSLWLNL
jgi:hypothetical protein